MRKLDKNYLLRIIQNAEALLKEAKVLRSVKANRRATFLAISACEEINKLCILVKNWKLSRNHK